MSEVIVKKIKSKSGVLLGLALEYLEARDQRKAWDENVKAAAGKIYKNLKIEPRQKLDEVEAEGIDRLSIQVEHDNYEESAKVSYYVTSRKSVDWEYLESVLTPKQLKRAAKVSYNTVLKVT